MVNSVRGNIGEQKVNDKSPTINTKYDNYTLGYQKLMHHWGQGSGVINEGLSPSEKSWVQVGPSILVQLGATVMF